MAGEIENGRGAQQRPLAESRTRSERVRTHWGSVPDAELVAAARRLTGDDQTGVFEEISHRHRRAVTAVCAWFFRTDRATVEAVVDVTFTDGFLDLSESRNPLKHPERLGPWLCGVARNRCYEELRAQGRATTGLDEEPADDQWESLSRARQARVDAILDTVVATFTPREQELFEACIRGGLRGTRLAKRLGVSTGRAHNAAREIQDTAEKGFGAYILVSAGRPHCEELASILDRYASGEAGFTRNLRNRVVRHFDTCDTCDRCGICIDERARLLGEHAPALTPTLVDPEIAERVREAAEDVAGDPRPGGRNGRRPPAVPLPAGPDASPMQHRRSSRRRVPAIVALVVALLIGAATLVASRSGDGDDVAAGDGRAPATGADAAPVDPSLPPGLAGELGDWDISGWQRDGSPVSGGTSTWAFDGTCASEEDCVLTLRVVQSEAVPQPDGTTFANPDSAYLRYAGENASGTNESNTYELVFVPERSGFVGTDDNPISCGGSVEILPMTSTDTVELTVTSSRVVDGREEATAMDITWASGVTEVSPEARAAGCDESEFVSTATAERSVN